jgi:hypothetical protein
MTKIMSTGCRLYHDMIETTKITKQLRILFAAEPHCDRAGNCRHLDRVGEPVVHNSAGRHRGDDLGHIGEPGEGGCEPDPLQVSAKL